MNVTRRLRFELNEIVGFFVEPTWGYPIALFRILYGLLGIWTSAFLFPNFERYYTELGRMPWDKVKHFPEHIYSVIALDPTNTEYMRALVGLHLLAAALLTLGVLSRAATIVIFVLQVAMQHRDPYILNSGDHLFLISSFLLAFTPLEQRLSLRNVIERRFFSERYQKRMQVPRFVWSTRLIGLQVCYVYLFAFAAKMNSQPWIRGTAMYDVLASPSLARFPAEHDHPILLALVTWGTLAFELGFPLLVWQKVFRPYVIVVGILFHLGIEFTMTLPMFSCLMMISYAAFLDDDEVQALLRVPFRFFGLTGPNEPSPAQDDPEESSVDSDPDGEPSARSSEAGGEPEGLSSTGPLLLRGVTQPYPWGSRTAIAEVLGVPPSGGPEAEYWLGAHPGGPALLVSSEGDLASWIAADPLSALGPELNERYQGQLPFLMKVLASASPLSLQAHPSREQAQAGFERERGRGVATNSPSANYKDANAKPELLLALTHFRALCGFSPLEEVDKRLRVLGLSERAAVLSSILEREPGLEPTEFRRAFVERALSLSRLEIEPILASLLARLAELEAEKIDPFLRELSGLIRSYPDDAGVLVTLLMNYVTIEPGQALFLPAQKLHAYLGGTGLEVMGSSDNVLRGGLTSKHVDVLELCRILRFEEDPVALLSASTTKAVGSGRCEKYITPAEEFELSLLELTQGERVELSGPALLLVLQGEIELGSADGNVAVSRGAAAFVPFATRAAWLEGVGSESRVARVTVSARGSS